MDDAPLPAGTLVRIDTTGGGGWGDPLEREPELVALDVEQGKVSLLGALNDYGVVLTPDGQPDLAASARLRASRQAEAGPLPLFDRGPGYRQLSGRDQADVDAV